MSIPRNTYRRTRQTSSSGSVSSVWLVTFSDLLLLLLTFFVLQFSMGSLEGVDIKKVLRGESSQKSEVSTADLKEDLGFTQTQVLREAMIGEQSSERSIDGSVLPTEIEVHEVATGSLINLGGSHFDSGSDQLSSQARETLQRIAKRLIGQDVEIQVAGHTDDHPIESLSFFSNWELSTSRAISVAEVLIAAGVPGGAISVVGYADTRPLIPNIDDESREKNRRVEILVRKRVKTSD